VRPRAPARAAPGAPGALRRGGGGGGGACVCGQYAWGVCAHTGQDSSPVKPL